MLFLIGMGLEVGDISQRATDVLRRCNNVLIDPYTNKCDERCIGYIEKLSGKTAQLLERSDLEENAIKIVLEAASKDIALLVSGDPLIATTHHTILDLAAKNRVKTEVFHASSIFSAAIGVSGLDIYKFGPVTTIPFWSSKYKPTSFIDVINNNLKNAEHTLILLDYNYKDKKAMDLEYAIDHLKTAQEEKGYNIISGETRLLVLGNVGKGDELIIYSKVSNLLKLSERFKEKVISLIFPSKPNFAEEESLKRYFISSI